MVVSGGVLMLVLHAYLEVLGTGALYLLLLLKKVCCDPSELQIRGGIEDKSEIIFLILNVNICCDPSSEQSH